jgi:hypothetical protein
LNGPGKWRWVVPAALVVALALSGSTFAAPVGQISEFPTPTANSSPEGIVAGPDGNLWFAELGANRIGEVNPRLRPLIVSRRATEGATLAKVARQRYDRR